MKEQIKLPKLGLTMENGTISSILIKVGDVIKKGDIIAEFETDKISSAVETEIEGKVVDIYVKPGDVVEVLAPICLVEKDA